MIAGSFFGGLFAMAALFYRLDLLGLALFVASIMLPFVAADTIERAKREFRDFQRERRAADVRYRQWKKKNGFS